MKFKVKDLAKCESDCICIVSEMFQYSNAVQEFIDSGNFQIPITERGDKLRFSPDWLEPVEAAPTKELPSGISSGIVLQAVNVVPQTPSGEIQTIINILNPPTDTESESTSANVNSKAAYNNMVLPDGRFSRMIDSKLGEEPLKETVSETKVRVTTDSGPTLLSLPVKGTVLPAGLVKSVVDPINKPSHYHFSQYEPVKVIQAWGLSFCLGNVVKYIARAGRKDSSKLIEDLEKAKRYIELELESLRKV